MSGTYYHVTTPLEEEWVDTSQDVTDVIDRYMQTEGASLLRVTVARFPDNA
jgi:hypothetical protein